LWSSTPLIFGICTSNIKHLVSNTDDERRNDSADKNVRAAYPSERTRLPVAAQTASSSSTIDISGISVKHSFQSAEAKTASALHSTKRPATMPRDRCPRNTT